MDGNGVSSAIWGILRGSNGWARRQNAFPPWPKALPSGKDVLNLRPKSGASWKTQGSDSCDSLPQTLSTPNQHLDIWWYMYTYIHICVYIHTYIHMYVHSWVPSWRILEVLTLRAWDYNWLMHMVGSNTFYLRSGRLKPPRKSHSCRDFSARGMIMYDYDNYDMLIGWWLW